MGMELIGCRLSSDELRALLDDPTMVDALLYGDLDDDDAEMPDPELDLGKSWHALHYLLTGTAWEIGDGAAGAAILGGDEVGEDGGVEVDHVTVYRWVQRFTPLLADVARFARHSPGDRWHVDETYVNVNGGWRYIYRAVDQYGQIIDVLVSARRDADAARKFFRRALSTLKVRPTEVVTDAAAVYPAVLEELIPRAWHHIERYANNPIEADHSRLKHRLRPMRGLRTDQTAQVIITGHAFIAEPSTWTLQLAVDAPPTMRVAAAFTELARAI